MTVNIKKEYREQLIKMYPSSEYTIDQIAEIMGVSRHTVTSYAKKLGLSRPKAESWNKLSESDERMIMENYEYGDFDELSNKIGKSKHAISEWARKRGLVRKIEVRRNGDLSKLLDGSLESCYWHGVLASDGYISKNGHLMFSQGEKDKDVVFSFAKFIDSKVYEFDVESGYKLEKRRIYRVNVSDKKIGKQIREMWGLKDGEQKTYSGMKLDFLDTEDKAKAFFIGMFDGDGYLTKNKIGKIEIHKNWLQCLIELNFKCRFESKIKINKRGFANLFLKKSSMSLLKKFINEFNIPHNPRKWDI